MLARALLISTFLWMVVAVLGYGGWIVLRNLSS